MRFTEVTRSLGRWRVPSYFYALPPRAELTFSAGWSIIKVQRWQRSSDGCSPLQFTRSNPQFERLAGYFLFLCSVENLTISHTSVATPTITSRSCKTSEIFAIITTPLPCGREFMFQKYVSAPFLYRILGSEPPFRRGRYRLCASYSTRFFLFLQVFLRRTPGKLTFPARWSIIKVQRWQRSSDGCSPTYELEVTRSLECWRVTSFLCPAAPRGVDFFGWVVYNKGTEVATVLRRLLP